MVRRRGELSSRMIDRDWPHQVALRADSVKGRSSEIKDEFCRDLSLCPRGHCVRRDGVGYVVFCFSKPSHANLFREHFDGERFNPEDRGRGREWRLWRKR
jgi:hypothetical protein